jgi:hypothetical protein
MTPRPFPAFSGHSRGAIGLLVALTGLGILWMLVLLSDLSDRRRSIVHKESELQALAQRASGRMAQGPAGTLAANPFLDGATGSLASNTLQERVVRILEEAGASVVSINIEPTASAPDPLGRRLMLQALAEATIDSLQKVLHRLEGEAPALFIDSLLVDRRTTGAADTAGAVSAIRLRIDLRISGYSQVTAP